MSKAAADGPLERYTRILEALVGQTGGLGLTDVAEATGLTSATTHRLLNSLVEVGLIQRLSSRTYIPGDRFLRLAAMAGSAPSVDAVAQPILTEMSKEFGETAYLGKLIGYEIEPVSLAQPNVKNSAVIVPGRRLPLYATSAGKAILAHQSEKFIERYLSRPRKAFTENTQVSEQEIRKELEDIRANRIAKSSNEFEAGLLNYACPVVTFGSQVIYAVAIIGILERFKTIPVESVRTTLNASAERLSTRISRLFHAEA